MQLEDATRTERVPTNVDLTDLGSNPSQDSYVKKIVDSTVDKH